MSGVLMDGDDDDDNDDLIKSTGTDEAHELPHAYRLWYPLRVVNSLDQLRSRYLEGRLESHEEAVARRMLIRILEG